MYRTVHMYMYANSCTFLPPLSHGCQQTFMRASSSSSSSYAPTLKFPLFSSPSLDRHNSLHIHDSGHRIGEIHRRPLPSQLQPGMSSCVTMKLAFFPLTSSSVGCYFSCCTVRTALVINDYMQTKVTNAIISGVICQSEKLFYKSLPHQPNCLHYFAVRGSSSR